MVKAFFACRDRKRPGGLGHFADRQAGWAGFRCFRLRRRHKANAAEVSSRPARRLGPGARAVGGSGVRKITLTWLPMHRFDPQEGLIYAEFRLAGLISAVFLNVCLCNDTVAANIRMARSDATEAGLRTSVDTAHSEGAGRLRPAIPAGGLREASCNGSRSRPLPKDAPIMIHDAPLAILASESELSVQRGIDAVRRW